MGDMNEQNLDTAIALGDAVCSELGICCEKRGRVIFRIYKKLEDVRAKEDTPEKPDVPSPQAEQNVQAAVEDTHNI
jgi:hypothetical protein